MEQFNYWQDAMENMDAEYVARMRRLIDKYGAELNPEEMSVGDEFEYNMVKNYYDEAIKTFNQ